jgi:hypothetical protein
MWNFYQRFFTSALQQQVATKTLTGYRMDAKNEQVEFDIRNCFLHCKHTKVYKNFCDKHKQPPAMAIKTCKGKDYKSIS